MGCRRMKKVLIVIGLSVLFLTGCDDVYKSQNEHINIDSKSTNSTDDINIVLKENWWVKDYSIDYENKQVILNIEKDSEE